MKKEYMLQCVIDETTRCDTEPMTLKDITEYWNEHYQECVEGIRNKVNVQMTIWENCKDNCDYSSVLKEIDSFDSLIINDDKIYKITETLIN